MHSRSIDTISYHYQNSYSYLVRFVLNSTGTRWFHRARPGIFIYEGQGILPTPEEDMELAVEFWRNDRNLSKVMRVWKLTVV